MKIRKYITILISICLLFSLYSTGAAALTCSGGTNCTHCNLFGMKNASGPGEPVPAKDCCGTTKALPCDLEESNVPLQPFHCLPQASGIDGSWFNTAGDISDIDVDTYTADVHGLKYIINTRLKSPPIYLQTLSLRI